MSEAWKRLEGQAVNEEFHLRQYLGGSEQGAVFLAQRGAQEAHRVAIKLIPADPKSSSLQLSRWELAAKLSHPHLIRIFQVGRCQLRKMALLYVVMEYAEEDLSQVLPERPLTAAEARDMLPTLLSTLAWVHGQGFVHGHLKPANLMAIGDQLKLSSDGLRRMSEPSGLLRKPGVYDPPETAGGAISPAGDIWSLGMTLVEVLTQRRPTWEGTEQREPVLPQTLPVPFLDIARHCLRRDPQQRSTIAEIAARLDLSSSVVQKPAAARLQKAPTKGRYTVPAMIAVGLALAAMLSSLKLPNRHQEAQPVPVVVPDQTKVPPKAKPEPKPKPETHAAEPSPPKSNAAKPSPAHTAPTPAALRPVATATTGGLVRGEVRRQVLPDVPKRARDTIQGTVRVNVRVAVDPSGSVVGATFDSPGPSKYFAKLALRAARAWEFAPAQVEGRSVSSEWILRFGFGRTGTKVAPVQVTP